jgi:hypothetical protein
MPEQPTPEPLVEPDNPAAYALASHIADHPISTVQAAFRYLNTPLTIDVHEDRPPQQPTATDDETPLLLFWDESASAALSDGVITIPIAKAVNVAAFAPAGDLILQVPSARILRDMLADILTEADDETQQQPISADTIPVPVEAFAKLVKVAAHVSRGQGYAFNGDALYPDATARYALGALDDAGLLATIDPPQQPTGE